jgi:hypothetical protein
MLKIKKYVIRKELVLNNIILNAYISNFWNDVFASLVKSSEKHLLLLCKVEFSDKSLGYRTLGHLRRVNFSDKELFINYLINRLGTLSDAYSDNPVNKIVFSYIICNGKALDDRKLILDLNDKPLAFHRFNNMNLPITMVPAEFGTVISKSLIEGFTRFVVSFNKKIFQIDVSLDKLVNNVTLLGPSELNWTDTQFGEGFKREIGKSTMYFVDGELVLRKQELNAKPFSKMNVESKLINNFVTMDIETITHDSKLVPYLICAYNGSEYITSYARSQQLLFTSFMNSLFTFFKGSSKLIVYAHNLSGFDGIFLLKHLIQFGKVEPILFNGRLISIKVKLNVVGHKNKTIIFKDSYLLLPLSLRMLCIAFNISIPKGYFPFKLKNIFYTGVLPKIEYWTGIPLTEYSLLKAEFKNTFWNFQDEAIKYCKLDCQTLHEIITNFNELIFNNFQVNIHSVLTLPALAMKIYKTHFMPDNTIYQLLGRVESFIRESYTGGAVDVYKPHNTITGIFSRAARHIKLYYYDVNSLYPTVMAKFLMPIGKPIAFEGNIRNVISNAYGFFFCKITSPVNLEHPILQRRIKTTEGIRTIAGLGTWTGWICSAEMDNAMKYGYTFEIIKGYEFKLGDIFSEYVNKMYNLRLQYPKGNAMNLVAKLLMNSLYGKFGMKVEFTKVDIFTILTDADKLNVKNKVKSFGESVLDFVMVNNSLIIVRNTLADIKYNQDQDMYHGLDVNIAIASAVTSVARVQMSVFKNNPLFNLYYSDTDSAVVDRPLPAELVGNELGQLKLEHVITKAVFLAPKVYGFITENGDEIIKVKGITSEVASDLTFSALETLLIKDSSREFTQEKWFKDVIGGQISLADVAYTLKVTSNKRAPIYINDGEFEIYNSTRPFNYNELNSK